ncbi:heme exporter protein CcmD [Celeribacter arenosi]|uniref:Heme exporter protein D n=1 Tax=Celeribacter arenosi TaxID=792649 RepID=A0ABP7KE11_9RHOB
MMPDLGKYATDVYAAYAISLLLLAGLIWRTIARARAVKKQLAAAEARLETRPNA